MKQWLISKIPTWFLHYWVWRNWRLVCSGHPRYAYCIEADVELNCRGLQVVFGPEKPFGVPEWLAKEPESFGYKDEPDDRRLR